MEQTPAVGPEPTHQKTDYSEISNAKNIYADPEKATSRNVKDGEIIIVVRNRSRVLIGKHAEIKGNK